jgi:type III secretory pathway component EscV
VQPAELIQDRQQVEAGELVGGNTKLALIHLLQFMQGADGLTTHVEQLFRILQQDFTGIGENAFARGAIEEGFANLVLELADRLTDRWLGAV